MISMEDAFRFLTANFETGSKNTGSYPVSGFALLDWVKVLALILSSVIDRHFQKVVIGEVVGTVLEA